MCIRDRAYPVPTVVCVHDKGMKEAWCLASSTDLPPADLIKIYSRRWGIECGFRDAKNLRFGMGMGEIHVSTPARRDRLWLIAAFSIALLTLLGAAGEDLGYDRTLRTSTSKRRSHSLLRQGVILYELIPTMPEHKLLPLMERFADLLQQQLVFTEMFGPI